jgi:hypothetical protein
MSTCGWLGAFNATFNLETQEEAKVWAEDTGDRISIAIYSPSHSSISITREQAKVLLMSLRGIFKNDMG